jgi:alpha-galactosidase/6-phospho-beta-glucosidase family protein
LTITYQQLPSSCLLQRSNGISSSNEFIQSSKRRIQGFADFFVNYLTPLPDIEENLEQQNARHREKAEKMAKGLIKQSMKKQEKDQKEKEKAEKAGKRKTQAKKPAGKKRKPAGGSEFRTVVLKQRRMPQKRRDRSWKWQWNSSPRLTRYSGSTWPRSKCLTTFP